MKDRYGLVRDTPMIVPKLIVLHHTVIPTMQRTYEVFYRPQLPDSRKELQGAGSLNVSSQFLVDRDGAIYQLMPENLMARHVIGLNHCAIGIENVGGTEELPLTRSQLRANIWLVNYLKEKYDIEYLIGHHEYQFFQGHELWLEKDSGYRTVKTDPGKKFMRKVRRHFKNNTFKPLPKSHSYE
jgi:N-acetyl-anhydromuramyl-L-alanine amidase AmpD